MIRQRYYNPGQLTDAELKASFVARQYELKELMRIIRDEPPGGPLQHVLIIGPRGMGKTSLGLRALIDVREDPELAKQWQPVPFFEESYGVSDLASLWLTALKHLADATGEPEWAKRADALLAREKDDERLAAGAYAALADYRRQSGRRPILFIENLDDLFAQMPDRQDLARLRSLLQERSDILLLGTAASTFEAITGLGEPFYEFFAQIPLRGLDRKETLSFLREIAQRPDFADLTTVLDNDPGRVEAVRSLTGGNPRLIALAAKMMAESPTGSAREDLERLIDDQTPYFKARIEILPAQARAVFHTLAAGWKPMTASEVATQARLSSSHASAQLRYLVDRGYVEISGGEKKRNKLYQVLERFYNVYYLLRFTRDQRQRLEKLIDFVSALFGQHAIPIMANATILRLRSQGSAAEEWLALEVLSQRLNEVHHEFNASIFWKNVIDLCKDDHADRFQIWQKAIPSTLKDDEARRAVTPLIERHLSLHPDDYLAHSMLGIVHFVDENFMVARQHLIKCQREAFLNPFYWNIIGTIDQKIKNVKDAVSAWRNVIILAPDNAGAYRNLTELEYNRSEFDAAIRSGKRGLVIDRSDYTAILYYIYAIMSQGDALMVDIAQNLAKVAASVLPNDNNSWRLLGFFEIIAGNFDMAAVNFRRFAQTSESKDAIEALAYTAMAAFLSKDYSRMLNVIDTMATQHSGKMADNEQKQLAQTLSVPLTWVFATGEHPEIVSIIKSSWLAPIFEPLLYAAQTEAGEDIGPLPVEMLAAVDEVRRQIAEFRQAMNGDNPLPPYEVSIKFEPPSPGS